MIGAALGVFGALSGTAAQRMAADRQQRLAVQRTMSAGLRQDYGQLLNVNQISSSALMRPPRPPVSRPCTYCGTTNPGHRCRSCGAPSC